MLSSATGRTRRSICAPRHCLMTKWCACWRDRHPLARKQAITADIYVAAQHSGASSLRWRSAWSHRRAPAQTGHQARHPRVAAVFSCSPVCAHNDRPGVHNGTTLRCALREISADKSDARTARFSAAALLSTLARTHAHSRARTLATRAGCLGRVGLMKPIQNSLKSVSVSRGQCLSS